jgi:hypothetical protein
MLRALIMGAVLTMAAAPSGASAQLASFGTQVEAKAMIERAIRELKANEIAAIAKFRNGEAGFRDRDLYVFCFSSTDGRIVTSMITDMIGRDVRTLKDETGRDFGLELYNSALDGQITLSTGYAYRRAGSVAPAQKASYLTRVGNVGCGVDYYK